MPRTPHAARGFVVLAFRLRPTAKLWSVPVFSVDHEENYMHPDELHDPSEPLDRTIRDEALKRGEEARERAAFHSREMQRWKRIARAEAARVAELEAEEPPLDIDFSPALSGYNDTAKAGIG
jgi:hypothetical protein